MTTTNWEALAVAVRRRRDAMHLRQADLEARGGPGAGTVRNIEQAARTKYAPRTFTQLEQALDWPAGIVEKILAGTVIEDELDGAGARPVSMSSSIEAALTAAVTAWLELNAEGILERVLTEAVTSALSPGRPLPTPGGQYDMTQLPPPGDNANWAVLAEAVKRRRAELRAPQDLSQLGGPGEMTVRRIERAETTAIRGKTKTQLEHALGWPMGLVDRLLAEEPT